jgi:hypothetical protein
VSDESPTNWELPDGVADDVIFVQALHAQHLEDASRTTRAHRAAATALSAEAAHEKRNKDTDNFLCHLG